MAVQLASWVDSCLLIDAGGFCSSWCVDIGKDCSWSKGPWTCEQLAGQKWMDAHWVASWRGQLANCVDCCFIGSTRGILFSNILNHVTFLLLPICDIDYLNATSMNAVFTVTHLDYLLNCSILAMRSLWSNANLLIHEFTSLFQNSFKNNYDEYVKRINAYLP